MVKDIAILQLAPKQPMFGSLKSLVQLLKLQNFKHEWKNQSETF